MKGIIFNLLEAAVIAEMGEDVWDDLLEDAGLDGAYTSLGNYPDEDIEALVASAAAKTGQTRAQVLHWFGQKALPLMSEPYASLFENHASSRDFVISVNSKIHPEVRKLYPDASCPFFNVKQATGRDVTMEYRSSRDMAELAHGFIDGAAQYFGDTVEVELSSSEPCGKIDQLYLRYANP